MAALRCSTGSSDQARLWLSPVIIGVKLPMPCSTKLSIKGGTALLSLIGRSKQGAILAKLGIDAVMATEFSTMIRPIGRLPGPFLSAETLLLADSDATCTFLGTGNGI